MKKNKQKMSHPESSKRIRRSSSPSPNTVIGADQQTSQAKHIAAGAEFLRQQAPGKAERCFRKVLKANPGHFDALNLMGVAAHQQGRHLHSLGYFRKALAVQPLSANAHINLGNALKALGQFDDARDSYVEALRIQPRDAQTHRELSTIKTYERDDPQIAHMLEIAVSPSVPDRDRMHVNFALGKAYDDMGAFDKAFHHFAEGNRLRKTQMGYDIAQDRNLFRSLKAIPWKQLQTSCSADKRPDKCKHKPIFLVGMLRSGTTLVEQILASHSQIHAAGELELLSRAAMPILSAGIPLSKTLTNAQLSDVRHSYCAGLTRLKVKKNWITDKMPLNFRFIGFILAASPETKIIHVRRDPRATCWSIFRHYFVSKGNGYAYDLEDLAEYYKLYADMMSFWKETFPGRIYELSYESLTENQEQQSRALIEYCGLDWEDQCLEFHKLERAIATASTMQVRQKLYQGSSEHWRNYAEHLEYLSESLADLG